MEATLTVGPSGSFWVEVDGERVIEKTGLGFPGEDAIVEKVRAKLK